jgi:hypothetical protein
VSQREENEQPVSATSGNANPHFSSILMPVFEGPDFAFGHKCEKDGPYELVSMRRYIWITGQIVKCEERSDRRPGCPRLDSTANPPDRICGRMSDSFYRACSRLYMCASEPDMADAYGTHATR